MNDTPQPAESKQKLTAPQQRSARRWKLVERSFTMAAVVVTLFLGWTAITGMQRLFSSRPGLKNNFVESAPERNSIDVRAAFRNGGYWQMADWQWEVGVTRVATQEVDTRLEQLSNCELPAELTEHQTAAIGQLMFALQNLPIQRREWDGLNEYQIDRADSKLRVVSKGSGENEVLISLGAAMPNPQTGDWSLFELRSSPRRFGKLDNRGQTENSDAGMTDHLLPLPPTTNRLCARTDRQGQLLFELVDSPDDLPQLVAQLSQSEWKVKPFRPVNFNANLTQALEDDRPGSSFLCENQTCSIHVWRVHSTLSDRHQLALMRIPTDNRRRNHK